MTLTKKTQMLTDCLMPDTYYVMYVAMSRPTAYFSVIHRMQCDRLTRKDESISINSNEINAADF